MIVVGAIITVFVVFIASAAFAIVSQDNSVFDIGAPLSAVLIFTIAFALCISINSPTKDITKSTNTTQYIDALEIKGSTTGSFFLGCGSLDSNPVYYLLVRTDRGDQLRSFDTSKCYIKEQSNQSPRIVETSVETFSIIQNKTESFWFDPLLNSGSKSGVIDDGQSADYFTIYIPVGSIDRSYKVE